MKSGEITHYSVICENVNTIFSSDPSNKVSSFFSSRIKIFQLNTFLPEHSNPKHSKEADCTGICPFNFTETWVNNSLYSYLYTVESCVWYNKDTL